MKLYLVLLIIPVLFISGCTFPGQVFGGDVLKPQTKTVHDGVKDVLVIKDIQTIPRSPVLPDQIISLSFILENRDNLRPAENVKVELFNAPGFRAVDDQGNTGELCNKGACLPEGENRKCATTGCDILPGEEKLIVYKLRTPSQDEIVNVKTDTRLDFKVTYDFSATLSFIMPVVNLKEIEKRQRSGDTTTLLISRSHSSGPLEIDVDIQGAPYFLHDFNGVLLFKLRDRGSGILLNSELPPSTNKDTGMHIQFDPRLVVESWPSRTFRCDINFCENKEKIELFRDESRSSMRFELDTSRVLRDIDTPFSSLTIKSWANYTYELRGSVPIVINPFENV